MTSVIGSVFLGDSNRHRVLSTSSKSSSTPPSSPPATVAVHNSGRFPAMPSSPPQPPQQQRPPLPKGVDPAVSLELRLRWLEAIVHGVKKGKERERPVELQQPAGGTLSKATQGIQTRLNGIVEKNDGLRKFMNNYDQHAHVLTPAFALSGGLSDPPAYQNMSAAELEALLAEMETDIRAADRDVQEIDELNKKGVASAGKLGDYETLQPKLGSVLKLHDENRQRAEQLEERIARLMDNHATRIDTLSELFVAWDDVISDAEAKVARLERERQERQRLGM